MHWFAAWGRGLPLQRIGSVSRYQSLASRVPPSCSRVKAPPRPWSHSRSSVEKTTALVPTSRFILEAPEKCIFVEVSLSSRLFMLRCVRLAPTVCPPTPLTILSLVAPLSTFLLALALDRISRRVGVRHAGAAAGRGVSPRGGASGPPPSGSRDQVLFAHEQEAGRLARHHSSLHATLSSRRHAPHG